MHERLGAIEANLTGLENHLLGVGAFLGVLTTIDNCWKQEAPRNHVRDPCRSADVVEEAR